LLVALLTVQSPSLRASADDPPKSRLEHLKEREERDSANETYWRGKHRKLLERQEKAKLGVADASEKYTRTRRRRRIRGGPSDLALKALNEARAELKAANSALAEFYEEAPRAGAKPGWIRTDD
jgi:hypothetical protein